MKEELIEKLAEIEHEQWIVWSQHIADKDNISKERLERWKTYWIAYSELDEETKELDRYWARKIIKVLEEQGLI